jgi:hypothetical protein
MRYRKAGLGAVVLILPFMPGAVTVGPLIGDGSVPIEVIAALAVPAGLSLGRPSRVAALFCAGLLALLCLLRLADILGPALVGRSIDLLADPGHLPWGWAAAGAAFLLLTGLFALAILAVGGALRDRRPVGFGILATALALIVDASVAPGLPISADAWAALRQQRATWADDALIAGSPAALAAALGPPISAEAGLGRLRGQDLYLVFFESYGMVLLDAGALAGEAKPAIAGFGARLQRAGLTLRSARIESPTYGGGSWLAHGTVDAGARLTSQRRYDLVTTTTRPTWATLMTANGYEAIDVMPGLEFPLAHQEFWGFDKVIGAEDLHYDGPWFGWFGIPDQVTLDWVTRRPRVAGKPLFAQIVLVSSHLPFAPVPPKLGGDVSGSLAGRAELVEAARTGPDWIHLGPAYLRSIRYDLEILADWIPRVAANGAVVILLGDHQPPALIGAASASHDVPIHVIARDPDLVRAIAGEGFVDGALPSGSAGSMGDLLGRFATGLQGSVQ